MPEEWQLKIKGSYSALLSRAQYPTEINVSKKRENQWSPALVEVRVQDIQGKSLVIVNRGHSLKSVDLLHFSQGFDPESNLYFSFISTALLYDFDCSFVLQSMLFTLDYNQCSVNF